jgi:hypothetical protein
VAPAPQVPAPSHARAAVSVPPAHDAVAQTVPEGQSRQLPLVHLPSVPQVEAAVAAQTPRGSAEPSITAPHVPSVPPLSAAEHAWQAPVHAVEQQTPSTQ